MSTRWMFKVYKQVQNVHGECSVFPTAATFDTYREADEWAHRYAQHLSHGERDVRDVRIMVESRREGRVVTSHRPEAKGRQNVT